MIARFMRGSTVALVGILTTLWLLEMVWRQDQAAGPGIPVLHELTDTYRQGWEVLTGSAGFVVPPPGRRPPADESGPLRVGLSWQADAIRYKLADKGFSKSRLEQVEPYLQYILDFRSAALRDMYLTGIPASITLAQGLLESNAGRSRLARTTRNHFGIKARQRPSVREKLAAGRADDISDADFAFIAPAVGLSTHHDDYAYDRFEVYESVEDSYRRHSDLLQRRCPRPGKGCYAWIWEAFPIQQEPVDIHAAADRYADVSGMTARQFFDGRTRVPYYAAQAAGLKMAGYATNPKYHLHLSYLIDTYELWRFDLDLLRELSGRTAAAPNF